MADETPSTLDQLYNALTPKHRQWADTYLTNGLNAEAAARACDYKNPTEGGRIKRRPEVAAYLAAALAEVGLDRDGIRARLEYYAGGSIASFVSVAPTERSYWVPAREHPEVRETAKRRGALPEDMDERDLSSLFGPEGVAQTENGQLIVRVSVVASELVIDWRKAADLQALGHVKKLKQGKDGSVDFELHDPMRALELLGKTQRMFTDKVEVGGEGGGPVQVHITRRIVGGDS